MKPVRLDSRGGFVRYGAEAREDMVCNYMAG